LPHQGDPASSLAGNQYPTAGSPCWCIACMVYCCHTMRTSLADIPVDRIEVSVMLTGFLSILHLQHAPPSFLIFSMPSRTALFKCPRRPGLRLPRLWSSLLLESKTYSLYCLFFEVTKTPSAERVRCCDEDISAAGILTQGCRCSALLLLENGRQL
jgi:hypothetical protein